MQSTDLTPWLVALAAGLVYPFAPANASSEYVVESYADTFTRDNNVSTNYGTEPTVRVQPWGNGTGFWRFDLSLVPPGTDIASATLSLDVANVAKPGSIDVHKVLGDWNELTLTGSNPPLLGPASASFPVVNADEGAVIDVDVTALVSGLVANPSTDFGIAMTHDGANAWFSSREAGSAALLTVISSGPASNTAPQVDPGSDQTVALAATATLSATVMDDGLPSPPGTVVLSWTLESGAGNAFLTDASSAVTDVSFDALGDYVLRLTADDGELQSYGEVTVTVVDQLTEQTLTAVADTFTRSNFAGTNYGAEPTVRVQTWGNGTGFWRFDLSSVPQGTAIASASLSLDIAAVRKAGSIDVRKVLGDWDELSLTESGQPDLGPVSTSFSLVTSDEGGVASVDVTALVNELVANPANDYGIALTNDGANAWFTSREAVPGAVLTVVPGGPAPNTAPQVDAGSAQTVWLTDAASLIGAVTDDGLPNPPGQVSLLWETVTGPGTVSFANDTTLVTTATFDAPGSYTLRLTAGDSELSDQDTVAIEVLDPNANQPPSADAGVDQSIAINTPLSLAGTWTDDGRPDPPGAVTITWSVVSGPGNAAITDTADPNTTVTFDTPGNYELQLTVNDGELANTDNMTVSVNDPTTPQTLTAFADTYTRSQDPGTNFGADTTVRALPWGNTTGFARFDLSGFPAGTGVANATLSLSVFDIKKAGTIEVRRVLGDWSELGLTRSTEPALSSPESSFAVSNADDGQVVAVDVTSIVSELVANPTANFGIALTDAGGNAWFDSKEAGAPMVLTITPGTPRIPRFTDIAVASDTTGPAHYGGHGAQFGDVDNDGWPDFYVTMNDISFGDMADLFYYNEGDGTFSEDALTRGIASLDSGSHGGVFFDFDNDGDLDLYNGAYDQNRLYENDGSGVFVDVTSSAELPARLWPTRGVAALDMEPDGDLDLVAVNGFLGSGDPVGERNEIYINDGDGTFTTIDMEPVFSAPSGQGITDVDYNNDGFMDLFTANRSGDVVILRNVAGTGFEIVAPSNIGINDMAGDGITFADVNNDTHLDIMLDDRLYLSDQDGTFTFDQAFNGPEVPYMGGFADLDNDSDLDIVFPGANFVYWNDGQGNFTASETFAIGAVSDPRSVAFADIDNDGDPDFFYAQKDALNILVRNDYAGSNLWLGVTIRRANGQVGAYGSRIYVYETGELDNPSALITWREVRSQDGYLAQNDSRTLMGVGANTTVDVRIVFPGGGSTTLTNVGTGVYIEVQE